MVFPPVYSNASRIPPGRYNNEKFDARGLDFYLFLLFVDHFLEKKLDIFWKNQLLAPSWAPRAFWGRFWMPKTPKKPFILEPKIKIFQFIFRYFFWHGFKMAFGRHLDHFGEPIGRLLVTFWDHFSKVNAREGFSDFWYPSEAFCLFLRIWVVGNSSQNHIKTETKSWWKFIRFRSHFLKDLDSILGSQEGHFGGRFSKKMR